MNVVPWNRSLRITWQYRLPSFAKASSARTRSRRRSPASSVKFSGLKRGGIDDRLKMPAHPVEILVAEIAEALGRSKRDGNLIVPPVVERQLRSGHRVCLARQIDVKSALCRRHCSLAFFVPKFGRVAWRR